MWCYVGGIITIFSCFETSPLFCYENSLSQVHAGCIRFNSQWLCCCRSSFKGEDRELYVSENLMIISPSLKGVEWQNRISHAKQCRWRAWVFDLSSHCDTHSYNLWVSSQKWISTWDDDAGKTSLIYAEWYTFRIMSTHVQTSSLSEKKYAIFICDCNKQRLGFCFSFPFHLTLDHGPA